MGRLVTARWLVPALGFVLLTGLLGVTIKLALRDVDWPVILLWTAIVYAAIALGSAALGNTSLHLTDAGGAWALASGVCAAGGLICSFIALRHADAVVAVPVMATYPVVTVLASLAFLDEGFGPAKAAGVGLVIAGVILLAR
jgi:drug/metabolite transporter (DMT)-like permease